jgi:hypothetical protein
MFIWRLLFLLERMKFGGLPFQKLTKNLIYEQLRKLLLLAAVLQHQDATHSNMGFFDFSKLSFDNRQVS